MRAYTRNLIFGALLALSTAGPAMAATWSENVNGEPTYTGIAHELTTPSTGQTTATRFFFRNDGSPDWMICQQIDTDNSVKEFDTTNCQQFRGGNTFGAATYQAPTSIGTSTLSIRWQTSLNGNYTTFDRALFGTYYLTTDETLLATTLTRTVIETGRPAPSGTLANFNAYWWDPDRSGTGVFMDVQGSSALLLFYGYASNGQAEWRIAHGALTTSTTGSFNFNRCSKSGTTVSCQSEGTVTIQLTDSIYYDQRRLQITYPSGVTETLRQYRF